jgi:hypothetical protein
MWMYDPFNPPPPPPPETGHDVMVVNGGLWVPVEANVADGGLWSPSQLPEEEE